MTHKRYTLIFSILLLTLSSKAGDWSQWWHITPGGNEISNQSFNDVNRILFDCEGAERPLVQFIDRWYFYKGYIIGTFQPNQPSQFFLIDEQSCAVDSFKDRAQFDLVLDQKGLKPRLWTRWYTSNWGFIFVGRGYGGFWDFLFFRGTWLLLPLMVLAMWWIVRYNSRRNLKWILALAYMIIIIFRIVLDILPGSV